MALSLTVGKSYNLYTNYETIVGQPIKVIGILTYSECSKVSYDINVLAINERVISVKDEDIEEEIGDDNIYWCRSTVANNDGTYNEYLVWDSIINFSKTNAINENYTATMSINISESANTSLSQVINFITSAVASNYSGVSVEISTPTVSSSTENSLNGMTEDQIEDAKAIINSINLWGSKLIPAVEKLTSSNIGDAIDDINNKLQVIQSNVSMVKHGI